MKHALQPLPVTSHRELSDHELLQTLQGGEDERAFQIIVSRHGQRFASLAYRITGRMEEAEDIVQEAFMKLWRDPFAFSVDKGVRFTTWFYRVVTNLALDSLRRNRQPLVQLELVVNTLHDGALQPATERHQEDNRQQLLAALRKLPIRQQVAIELHYFDELTQGEAAFVMQLSDKAYQSLLHRGKQALRPFLSAEMLNGFE